MKPKLAIEQQHPCSHSHTLLYVYPLTHSLICLYRKALF